MSGIKVFQSGEEIPSDYQEIGHVSVSGKSTLDEVEQGLIEEATKKGADALKITSAGGNNKQNGTGVIYQHSGADEHGDADAE